MSESQYQKGRARREQLFGKEAEKNVSYLKELAPDLERIVMENLFGDFYCRTNLDPRIRSLCTLSVLAAQGREVQLKYHIKGALNVGATQEEIVETLMHLLFYAGLPAASTGLKVAKEVFAEMQGGS
jgi:4-carboxymuconolactone decarboxylase